MSAEENKAVIRRFVELLNEGDLDRAFEGHPGLYEARQRYPYSYSAFPDLTHTIEQQVVEGDIVVTRGTLSGTHQGEFFGTAPTGRRVTFGLLMMDTIEDGKIVLHYANVDWLSVLLQIGALTPPAQSGR